MNITIHLRELSNIIFVMCGIQVLCGAGAPARVLGATACFAGGGARAIQDPVLR